MLELRELKEVTNRDGVAYLRFSNLPIAHTKSYANGEVNVDLDAYDCVVGIEMLSFDPEEFQALAKIVQDYKLSLAALFHARK